MAAGNNARVKEIRDNGSGLFAFAAHTFGGYITHMTDRFCHCDIDCSDAYGA